MPVRYGQWKLASMYASHKSEDGDGAIDPVVKKGEGFVAVTFTYLLPTTPKAECTIAYTVVADGTVRAKLGVYRNPVSDNMAKYLVPQECGNKMGVRYAKVLNGKGHGLLIRSNEPMHFSALPYTPHEMENAMHAYELPQVHYTVIRAAKAQMGVGGDNSWGAKTHSEYLIDCSKRMEFEFSIKGM